MGLSDNSKSRSGRNAVAGEREIGTARLKGFDEPVRLFRLEPADKD